MIRKRNVRTRRSAVLTAFAASAREWNGDPASACPAAAGAAKTGLAPPPPSIPGDAEIDSVAGAAPVFIELSRSMLSSHLLPRTQSPDDRSKLQLAYKILRSPDTAASPRKTPFRESGRSIGLIVSRSDQGGPQHTKRVLIPPPLDRAA